MAKRTAQRRRAPKRAAARPVKAKTARIKSGAMTAKQAAGIISYPRQISPVLRDLDDIMIYGILTGSKTGSVSRLSLDMVSAISSTSDSILNLDYKHGVNVGRKLFNMVGAGKRYSWYGEAIPDLTSFIEKAGYGAVTYRLFPFSVSIKIHQRSHNIGAKTHTFEAGMISGFLTAAKGQLVHVNEGECSSNGCEYCDFVTSESRVPEAGGLKAESVYGALKKDAHEHPSLKREYYSLATSGISGEHIEALGNRAFELGSRIGGRIAAEHAGSEDAAVQVMKVIRVAYPGAVSVKRVSPTNVRVSFDQLSSRKGAVELMRRFVEGAVSAAFGVDGFNSSINTAKDNSYSMTVRIK